MNNDPQPAPDDDGMAAARHALVATVEREVAMFGAGDASNALDPRVKDALARVPRHRFVSEDARGQAYENRPLPIGHGQTISQPLVVALMTQHLHLTPQSRVLEIGTGSGYQTAMLAELAREVVTVEIVEPLAARAKALLEEMGYRNVVYRVATDELGAPDLGPYDGIVVTAAAKHVPDDLVAQLAPGGRLVIPVGGFPAGQDLLLVTRTEQGEIEERFLFPVAFVPLTGDGGRG